MTVRSKEQLSMLLKLIDVNNVTLTRKNLSVRQKFWQAISEKLNDMDGAEKDADGWKRSYQTWRTNVGQHYRKELQMIIADIPDDEYFYINISEDEDEDLIQEPSRDQKMTVKNPTEKQKTRLHELIMKHREILNSTADDEPLKARIWLNITDELNAIPRALKLTSREWQERVDWDRYKVRRGRKPFKRPVSTNIEDNVKRGNHMISDCQENVKDIEFELIDEASLELQDDRDSSEPEYEKIEKLTIEEVDVQHSSSANSIKYEENDDSITDEIDTLLNDVDEQDDYVGSDLVDGGSDVDHDDITETAKGYAKRIKPSPIVKSFKFSHRIVKSVEKLNSDVCDIKELLSQTTKSLNRLEQVLHQQTKQQKLTNALLKRNGQLLKVLVQYKSGRRSYIAD